MSLRAAALAVSFLALSFIYSLTTWGLGPPPSGQPVELVGLALHMAGHALFAGSIALLARQSTLFLLGIVTTLAIDVDHVGPLLDWPVVQRASHSLGFLLLAPLTLGLLAGSAKGRLSWPVATVTFGAVAAHICWDSLTVPGMPFWLPLTPDVVDLPLPVALGLPLVAGIAISAARHARRGGGVATG